jgi:RimJ/RimL family protein N-acetyltransferase
VAEITTERLNYQDDLDRCGFGFWAVGLPEVVAVTMARNVRSQAVMRRIGMTTDPAEDFDDPDVDEGPLRRHVVYRKLRDPEH